MQIKSRHLVILHHLSITPQTVYSMAHGDVGMITGATEMGVHHACKALEELGLISTKSQRKGARTVQVKSATKKGKQHLKSVRAEPMKELPSSLCDFYVLDNIKTDPSVHEALISLMTRKRSKAKTGIAKEWYDCAINRYSKTV